MYNRVTMKFNRFLGRIGKKPTLHTNAMAAVATDQAKQSSVESFEKRRATDSNRQFVRRYDDSKLATGHQADVRTTMAEMAQRRNTPTISIEPQPHIKRRVVSNSKLDIVKPSRQAYSASPHIRQASAANQPVRHRFTEPPSRYR